MYTVYYYFISCVMKIMTFVPACTVTVCILYLISGSLTFIHFLLKPGKFCSALRMFLFLLF